ncbi:hypothetical protein BGW36DRAFT_299500, partial [Talaromyces proteolyticus]
TRATAVSKTVGHVKMANSIHKAVQPSDMIFSCLADDTAVKEMVEAAVGSGDVTEKLFVDCSTIHPDTAGWINEKFRSYRATYVAYPVFGPPSTADSGQLVIIFAGAVEDVQRVKAYTVGVISRADIDLGNTDVGKASIFKLLRNTFIISFVEAVREGMVLCEKLGIE